MPFFPNPYGLLNSMLGRIETAVQHAGIGQGFDALVARIDNIATTISTLATRLGLRDTDDTAIVTTMGGDATAVGEHTFANTDVRGLMEDTGLVSYAVGRVSTTAVAEASEDRTALATTSTFVDIAGADLVLVFTEHGETPLTAGGDVAVSTTTTTFVAIDLEFWDRRSGPLVVEVERNIDVGSIDTQIEGNVATLTSRFDVLGADTYVDMQTSALAIEDAYSGVSATVVATGN